MMMMFNDDTWTEKQCRVGHLVVLMMLMMMMVRITIMMKGYDDVDDNDNKMLT